jgi:hypothetical protein
VSDRLQERYGYIKDKAGKKAEMHKYELDSIPKQSRALVPSPRK